MPINVCFQRGLWLALLALLPAVSAHGQSVIYVNQAASGANDGTTWADAFTALQDALAAAQPGDEVWVAQGTYRPDQGQGVTEGDRAASFRLKNGVGLYGGFAGTEMTREERDWEANETVLSGDLLDNDNDNIDLEEPTRADNSLHVVQAVFDDPTLKIVLDGFTLSGGNANVPEITDGSGLTGGGLLVSDLNTMSFSEELHFVHLHIEKNTASIGGGALLNNVQHAVLKHVHFSMNAVRNTGMAGLYGGRGGGLSTFFSSVTMEHVSFFDNVANVAGAMFSDSATTLWSYGVVQGNEARSWAGAVQVNSEAKLDVWNVLFAGNRADRFEGGAMLADESEVTLTNVVFTGNIAEQDGGAYFNGASRVTLVNVTLSGNHAGRRGGAIYSIGGDVNPDFAIVANNTLFWGNTATEEGHQLYNQDQTRALLRHSLIEDTLPEGTQDGRGNLFSDPLFIDPDGPDNILGTLDDDLGLMMNSPAIDAGDNEAVPQDTLDLDHDGDKREPLPIDLAGNQRLHDGGSGMVVVDIGAYEFGAPPVYTSIAHLRSDHAEGLQLEVYPNPFQERAFIVLRAGSLRNPATITVGLFDLLGRKLKTIYPGILQPDQSLECAIEANGLPSGLYYISVSGTATSISKAIIVRK